MQARLLGNPKVTMHWFTVVADVLGQDKIESLLLEDVRTLKGSGACVRQRLAVRRGGAALIVVVSFA